MNLSFHTAVLLALQSHNPTRKGSSFERHLLNALIVSRRWNGTVSSETPDECRILSAEAHLREEHSGGAGRLQPYRGAARREGRVQGHLLLRGRLRKPSGDARPGRHHDDGSHRGGPEVIFPEALESGDEFREFRKKVKAPLLANMTEFGKTPYLTAAEFEEMGYNIVIFPMTPFRAMLKSVKSALEALMRTGTQKGILKDLMTRSEIYEVIDYYRYEQADKRAMESARRLDKP